ncbi:flavin monoamine oxidase family protein [Bacillus sp. Marseille-P3661]|uniref:flavin monoamine oxidase family protein n=1 Tax=Bacillus sp. Marseille-P3661 TaxID=1936234 RepID=UPI000C85E218|nr:FAD-dependent oxidoreductase [Bacillus sp. Marseille-P3661]
MLNVYDVDIVIVGAGMAGLAAALECKKHQISFVVLEARNRPGGRLCSILTEDNITIDLGAQWVSTHHHRVKSLIKDFGLHTTSTFTKGQTLYQYNGKIKKSKSLPPLSPLGMLDLFMLKRKIKQLVKQLPDDVPLSSGLCYQLDKQTVAQFIQANMFSEEGRTFYKMSVEEVLCTKAEQVSLLDLLWCIKSTGFVNYLLEAEHEWIVEGAQTLAERVADFLGQSIFFNTPVEGISYGDKRTIVLTKEKDWCTKKVIITIPPNLTNEVKFHPPLPAKRIKLSECTNMPAVIKMVLVYPQPFWRNAGLNGKVYSNVSPVILTMDSSPPDGIKGILTVFISGDDAEIMSKYNSTKRKHKIIQTLVKFFGPKAGQPETIYEKDWSEDRWTQGGYGSHYTTGVLTKFGTALFERVSSLYWAGTENATEWRTYMEGAVESGQRVANEIINELKHIRK